jgi:hypothetical protein
VWSMRFPTACDIEVGSRTPSPLTGYVELRVSRIEVKRSRALI